jgi:hypothetical protein
MTERNSNGKDALIILLAICAMVMATMLMSCGTTAVSKEVNKQLDYFRLKLIVENPNLKTEQKEEMLMLIDEESNDSGQLLFELRHEIIINNDKLDAKAKRWWLLIIMQYKDWDIRDIQQGLYLYDNYGDICPSKDVLDKINVKVPDKPEKPLQTQTKEK